MLHIAFRLYLNRHSLWYVLDDSVLLSSDVEKRCAIPVLGYRTAKPDEQFGALLDAQLRAKASQSAFQEISLDTVLSGTMGDVYKRQVYGFSLVSVREKSKKITRKMEHLHFLDRCV